jgi:hypothetical protein
MSSTGYVEDINVSRIRFDEVGKILESLKQQKETINKVYNTKIIKVLESSQQCFQVANLNYAEINETIAKTFNSLDKKYYNLIDVLENNVLRGYTEVVLAIQQMFNSEFASQMSELLGVSHLIPNNYILEK